MINIIPNISWGNDANSYLVGVTACLSGSLSNSPNSPFSYLWVRKL